MRVSVVRLALEVCLLFFFLSATSSAIEEIHPKQVPFNSQLPQDMNCNQTFKDHALLIDMNLSGMNLSGAHLNHSELQGSDLRGTNLSRSYLNQSSLFDADAFRSKSPRSNYGRCRPSWLRSFPRRSQGCLHAGLQFVRLKSYHANLTGAFLPAAT